MRTNPSEPTPSSIQIISNLLKEEGDFQVTCARYEALSFARTKNKEHLDKSAKHLECLQLVIKTMEAWRDYVARASNSE